MGLESLAPTLDAYAPTLPPSGTQPDAALCAHCQGPLLACYETDSNKFCCPGCAVTYRTLHTLGLTHYYELRRAAGSEGRKVATSSVETALFDSDAFWAAHVRTMTNESNGVGRASVKLLLAGVHCVGCVWVLEQLPAIVKGVIHAELSFSEGVLSIEFDPAQLKLSHLAEVLAQLGYCPSPYTAAERHALEEREQREFLLRIGVAGFGFMNTMLIATSLYQGYFSGMDPWVRNFFHWVSLVIAFPVILYAGKPFFQSFVASVVARRLHMDIPIAAGISVTMLYSMWNTFVEADRVYFDSVCALVFLLLLGRFTQQRALLSARRSTAKAILLLPLAATVRRDNRTLSVPPFDIRPTDTVLVPAGSRVPVDGKILSGHSSLNAAVMTGESVPLAGGPGDTVFAGYLNLEAPLEIQPSGNAESSRLAKLLTMLEEGALKKSPLVESAEKILSIFIGVLLVLAAGTFMAWIPSGFQAALDATVSLLVICCPCALALATPLALATGVRRAAAQGMLIRHAEVIERLARIKRIYFDKTGTLTQGTFEVVGEVLSPESQTPLATAQCVAKALADVGAAHPLSQAIAQRFCALPPSAESSSLVDIRWRTGLGVEGRDAHGALWRLGSSSFAVPDSAQTPTGSLTAVFLSRNHHQVLRFDLKDRVAPRTPSTLEHLRTNGLELNLLSGDHPQTVLALGKGLGFRDTQCFGGCSPETKQQHVERAGEGTMMVGDGVNDATALAAADVGVAVHGDALRCLESADVALVERDLSALPALLAGARRTVRIVRENVGLSLVYNVVGAAAAMLGMIDPLAAAIIMPLSSLTVLANSYFSRSFVSSPLSATSQRT